MRFVALIAVCSALVPAAAYAQADGAAAAQLGSIAGVAFGEDGLPLAGVNVTATGPSLMSARSTQTDANGRYALADLPPGSYEVTFYYAERRVTRDYIAVTAGTSALLSTRMPTACCVDYVPPAPAPRLPSLVVTAEQLTTLTPEYLRNVPGRSRTYDGRLGAAPGAQGDDLGIGFSGAQSVENAYVIDGLDTTGLTYGDGGSPLLDEFIEELDLVTGGFDASVGRAMGGLVRVTTKRGTNAMHGSLFAHTRPFEADREIIPRAGSALTAKTALAYDVDFGFDLGGPIIKDKLWFYVGFAPQLVETTVARIASTRVDRRFNNVTYGANTDADANPATNGNAGCELLSAPAGLDTACESDRLADIDPATGFELHEEIDRKEMRATVQSYQFVGKLNWAPLPGQHGQLTILGSPSAGHGVGVLGTPNATQSRAEGGLVDVVGHWSARLMRGKVEVAASAGWHHETNFSGNVDPALDQAPQIRTNGNLGTVGRNPDQPESFDVLQFCTDGGASIRDDFPTITNCPVLGYAFNSLGSFTDTREDRYSGKVSASYRFRFQGDHRASAGLAAEENQLFDGSGLAGGIRYRLSGTRYWSVFRYAHPDPDSPDTCGFAPDGVTLLHCNFLGEPGDPFTRTVDSLALAGFVSDHWMVLPNLSIDAGLRVERQRLGAASELADLTDPLTGKNASELAPTVAPALAPRVGVVYDWTRAGRSRLYATWGRYLETIPLDLSRRAFGGEMFYEGLYDARDPQICTPWLADPRGADFTPQLPSDPRTCDLSQAPVADAFIGGGNAKVGLPPGFSSLAMPGLKPQYLDEIVFGAEYAVSEDLRVGLAYRHRSLGRAVEDLSTDGANTYVIANPGAYSSEEAARLQAQIDAEPDPDRRATLQVRADMFKRINQFDKPRRDYDAVELTALAHPIAGLIVQGSYTYSHSRGNYAGLYSPTNGQLDPNLTSQYDLVELLANREGPLPNDRPHNLKIDAWYRFDLRAVGSVTAGARFRAISGVPINTLGASPLYGPNESFILPRGSAGRTAFQTGLDLRLQYTRAIRPDLRVTVSCDLFNVFNQQDETSVDEQYTVDAVNPIVGGTTADLNYLKISDTFETRYVAQKQLNYGHTDSRSMPLSARLGVRIEF